MKALAASLLALGLAVLPACREGAPPAAPPRAENSPAPTNRVDIPPAVRQNLGITFATVERRAVGRSIRVPGRFELLPTARKEYHAAAPGRVELLVGQYQEVSSGTPLYRIDSPRLRELQQQIADAQASVGLAQAGIDTIGPLKAAHERHEDSLRASVDLWAARISQLEQLRQAGGGAASALTDAIAAHAAAKASLAEVLEKDAELDAQEARGVAELQGAKARFSLLLSTLASLTGHTENDLMEGQGQEPLWRRLTEIEVRAASPGVVESLGVTPGAWVEQPAAVLTTIEPRRVRFRARALQSDLGRFRDGLPATVLLPERGSGGDPASGPLLIAPTADPEHRTVELIMTPERPPPWARAGVAAFLEVVTEGGSEEMAIPLGAVARDGLTPIIFRRDPKAPDKAIRVEADLGLEDGRWVVIKSGVKPGDEVVLDGVYQLMVATSGTIQRGGHFHADGTFHEGDD